MVNTFVELEQEDRYQLSRSHKGESRVVNKVVLPNMKLSLPEKTPNLIPVGSLFDMGPSMAVEWRQVMLGRWRSC